MHRTYGVADRALDMGSKALCDLDREFHIPDVIDRVEDPENVNAVFISFCNEFFNHVIRVVPVSDQVLPAKKHLGMGIVHFLLDIPKALPWIFIQVSDTAVKGGTPPHFKGEIPYLVQMFDHFEHVPRPHPGGQEGLVCIPEDGFSNFYTHG